MAHSAKLSVAGPQLPELAHRSRGRGRAVVLVHGLGADSSAWRLVAPTLAKSYRVTAVDLLGCGASPKPRAITLERQAAGLARLLRRLSRATLVGHSYGGAVALLAAAQLAAERRHLAQLVLVSPAAFPHQLPRGVQLAGSPLGLAIEKKLPSGLQAATLLRACFYDQSKVTAETLRTYTRALTRQRASLAAVAQSLWLPKQAELNARYRRVTVPTLLVWGSRDRVVPKAHGLRLQRALRHAKLTAIPRCGHLPQEERPPIFWPSFSRSWLTLEPPRY